MGERRGNKEDNKKEEGKKKLKNNFQGFFILKDPLPTPILFSDICPVMMTHVMKNRYHHNGG